MDVSGQMNPGFEMDDDTMRTKTLSNSKSRSMGNDCDEISLHNIKFEDEDDDPPAMIAETNDDGDLRNVPDDVFEDLDPSESNKMIAKIEEKLDSFLQNRATFVTYILYGVIFVAYICYFSYAMYYERLKNAQSITLLWLTCLVVFIAVTSTVKRRWGEGINDICIAPVVDFVMRHWPYFKISFCVVAFALFATYIGVMIIPSSPYNLVSLAGAVVFVSFSFVFSKKPSMIKWRVVFWGLGLQFLFALVTLKTVWGYAAFEWIGKRITEFVNYSEAGVIFVFGEAFVDHFFAMRLMPTIIYFYAATAILYHWGVIQAVISKFGWLMQVTVGTTAPESTAAAANCFFGMDTSAVIIAPLLPKMTDSELHCLMVGGLASISAAGFGTYIFMGVPANHLLSASLISAPAALAISKLLMPETQKSKFERGEAIQFQSMGYRNAFDAACKGAAAAVTVVAYILANLIVFISLLSLIDGILTWIGMRVGIGPPDYQPVTFEFICEYIMWPVAFCLGTPVEDCQSVARLVGIKTFLNEYVGYTELGVLISNRIELGEHVYNNGSFINLGRDIILLNETNTTNITLLGGVIQRRSEVICTYALCGFSNFGSIGVLMGILAAMAPSRLNSVASCALRSLVAGSITCFMTACTAGLLYDPTIEGL